MIPTRRHRLLIVLFALISLLFMQLAVASYACPGAKAEVAEHAAMAGLPCAESMTTGMDEDQPNLCRAHCQTGQQAADKYELPAPTGIGSLPVNFTVSDIAAVVSGVALQAPHLKRTTAPPVAILNCCFRL